MTASDLFLSRARLRQDASAAALTSIFLTEDADQRLGLTHKLLWTLFADGPERRRDFLWREAAPGQFYLLSARLPVDRHALFDLDPPKPFAPAFDPGDRLQFSLRANPTIARRTAPGERGKRSDVVMHAIKPATPEERADLRRDAIQTAGADWLRRQGERHGFDLKRVHSDRYSILRPPHGPRPMRIATLDFDGILRVTDPAAFLAAVARGFGRAKAYGCGMMLLRRA